MSYRLETTRRAKADRDACFDFIFARSPEGALRWLDAFEAAAAALLTEPHYGEAPESEDTKRQSARSCLELFTVEPTDFSTLFAAT